MWVILVAWRTQYNYQEYWPDLLLSRIIIMECEFTFKLRPHYGTSRMSKVEYVKMCVTNCFTVIYYLYIICNGLEPIFIDIIRVFRCVWGKLEIDSFGEWKVSGKKEATMQSITDNSGYGGVRLLWFWFIGSESPLLRKYN